MNWSEGSAFLFCLKNRGILGVCFFFFCQNKVIIEQKCGCCNQKIGNDQEKNQVKAFSRYDVRSGEERRKDSDGYTHREDGENHMQKETADEGHLGIAQNQITECNHKSAHKTHNGRGKVDIGNVLNRIDDQTHNKPNNSKNSTRGVEDLFEDKGNCFHNSPKFCGLFFSIIAQKKRFFQVFFFFFDNSFQK